MKTILVAEDNDSNYILMTYILKRDYQYDRAKNGQEAVEKANTGNYDLVLMDIKMPVMDGLQATALIKERRPDLPVIALTANAFDNDRQLALKAGCDEFLSKPVNSAKCLETIAKFIGK
jgi:CheY-like chemotaxis protein